VVKTAVQVHLATHYFEKQL